MNKSRTISNLLPCFWFYSLIFVAVLRFSISYPLTASRNCLHSGFGLQHTRSTRTIPTIRDKAETGRNIGIRPSSWNFFLTRQNEETLHSDDDELWQRRKDSWVLLVDDEEPIRRAVGEYFLDQGYQVTTCADGAAALQLARSKPVDDNTAMTGEPRMPRVPDCIVSDIRMPVMDGLELLRTIRFPKEEDDETTMWLSQVPVVLLTAKGQTQDRIAGYDSGADNFLTKPFSPEELVAIVDNLIQRSRNLRVEHEDLHKTVTVDDLKSDLDEIKNLLLNKGGGGIGNGWVQQTNIFLSKDERAVLEHLSRGLITKEIATKTHLSTRRIEQLLTGMFRKTGVKNRTELVRWAVSTGNVE